MDYKELESNINKEIINNLKIKIEKLNIKLNKDRDKKRYIIHSLRTRTITTKYGVLTYSRYIYKYYNTDINKWMYINFIDEKIGVTKNRKLHDALVEEIIKQISTGKRYRDVTDMFKEAYISTMTISRIYRSVNYKNFFSKVNEKIDLSKRQNIYINIDDAFVPVLKRNKRKKQRVRMFTFHTGITKISKSRNKLLNKRVAFMITDEKKAISTEEFANEIFKYGNKFFNNFEQAHLIVGGDGAPWIKNTAYYIGADYILDKFHAVKYLRDTFIRGKAKYNSINWTLFSTCVKYFENGLFDDLMIILKEYASSSTYNYFKNNKKGIITYNEKWNIGVSAESDVSRVVKSSLGYGSKLYNWKTFSNIINLRAYNINNYGQY